MEYPGRSYVIRALSAALALAICAGLASAKPKAKAKESDTGDASQTAGPAAIELPDDANLASLQVSAVDTIYELDLSVPQLNALRELASGAGESVSRTAATASPQFVTALKSFAAALLDAKDDEQIAKLRNQVIDLANGADVHLDADITPTTAARAKAVEFCSRLKASQLAAFLAVHAEEVIDPQEALMSAADGLVDLHTDANAKAAKGAADKSADPSDDMDSTIRETSLTVGYLVGGMDQAKAKAATEQAAQWLRDASALTETTYPAHRAAMEESAKRIVGDAGPFKVLEHWTQEQIATLMSNPQLPEAIDATLKSRLQSN